MGDVIYIEDYKRQKQKEKRVEYAVKTMSSPLFNNFLWSIPSATDFATLWEISRFYGKNTPPEKETD